MSSRVARATRLDSRKSSSARTLHRRFHVDLLLGLDRLRLLRKLDGEHALLEARLDLVGVNTFRQRKAALERTEGALTEVIVLLLLFFFFLLLALYREAAVDELHLDVFLVHARQLRRQVIGVVLLGDVDSGSGAPSGELTRPERLHVEDRAAERGPPQAAIDILEKATDFAAQAFKGLPRRQSAGTRRKLFISLHKHFGCFSHIQVLRNIGILVIFRRAEEIYVEPDQIQLGSSAGCQRQIARDTRSGAIMPASGLVACRKTRKPHVRSLPAPPA